MKLYCAWSSFLQNWDRRIINKIYYCYYYLIKNGNGEGGGKEKEKEKKQNKQQQQQQQQQKTGGGGWSEGSRKDWAELYGCIKWVSNDQSLQWQSLENLSLSLSLPSSIMSQAILCNYFKVCMKFTLEGVE